ncbi:MAG: hypothetical protein LBU12_01480 [Deltaproteobacteria bacterium]|jgi:hypothetical protein|nr:hypothetical protein [Deltaproteobacteria bacterium]
MKTKLIGLLLIALMTLALAGCTSAKRLVAEFRPQGGAPLTPATVQLLVQDLRPGGQFVGPEALSRDLFRESQGGQVDLTTAFPTGATVSLSHLTVPVMVYEAVKAKLGGMGVAGQPDTAGAKARVTIIVKELSIDVVGSDLLSRVSLEAVIDRPGLNLVHRSNSFAESSKLKLLGDMGGSEILGDALTRAINSLDFSGLNNF